MSNSTLKTFSVRLKPEHRRGLQELEETTGIASGEILRMAINTFLREVRQNGGILFPIKLAGQKVEKKPKSYIKAKRSA